MEHSQSYSLKAPAGPAGENLAMGYSSLERATAGWYNEVKDCGNFPGCKKGKKGVVGHFTALIWKGATELGCGINHAKKLYVCHYKAGDKLSGATSNVGGDSDYKAN